MSRLAKFEALARHPWYFRVYDKLKPEAKDRLRNFIVEREFLSSGDFYEAIQRAFPRNTKEDILGAELLLVINFEATPRRRT